MREDATQDRAAITDLLRTATALAVVTIGYGQIDGRWMVSMGGKHATAEDLGEAIVRCTDFYRAARS